MDAPVIVDVNPISAASRLDIDYDPFLNGVHNTEYGNKGFPFDDSDSENRDSRSFSSHLDDLARRHPELAQHLSFDNKFKEFPFRSNTWGHNRRQGSTSDNDNREATGSRRSRFGTPVGAAFEKEFGFPFNRKFEEDQVPVQKEEPKQAEKATEKPPQVPTTQDRSRKQNPNVPQSNTVDLGQKQEPVKDIREHRSMSAPPENRAGQQRFVSSINIPVQNENDPSAGQPQQFKQQQSTNERVIPIHVEGRNEPVMPKNANHTFNQQQPQPERTFNQRQGPGFGTWNRGDGPYYGGEPQFHNDQHNFFNDSHRNEGFGNAGPFKQQKPQAQPQNPPPPPQHQQQPQQPQHQQQPQQPPQQPQHPPQQSSPPPPPPVVKLTPIEQIQRIQKDVLELMNKVEKFNGKPKDKECVYLDEMLTRNLLKLDDVETEGKENIRNARKEAIKCIQKCISILEAKANANELLHKHFMNISNPPLGSLEVSGVSRSGTETSIQQEEPAETNEVSDNSEIQEKETKEATPMQTNESELSLHPNSTPAVQENVELATPEKEVADVEMASDGSNTQGAQEPEGSNQPMDVIVEEPKGKKDKKKVKKKVDNTENK